MMETFDRCGASFVSVTQQFNTTTSLGRLTLHILLSFAQFERELISERTRDKMAEARKKGKWVGRRCQRTQVTITMGSHLRLRKSGGRHDLSPPPHQIRNCNTSDFRAASLNR